MFAVAFVAVGRSVNTAVVVIVCCSTVVVIVACSTAVVIVCCSTVVVKVVCCRKAAVKIPHHPESLPCNLVYPYDFQNLIKRPQEECFVKSVVLDAHDLG